MTGAAIASLVVAGITTAVGGTMQYYNGKRQAKAVQQQAEAEAENLRKQRDYENERAAIAQLQGEQEAERRSRTLAADIGSLYANAAGNGLLVDGAGGTVGDVLRTTVTEGQADISTIRDNAAMNVWTHQTNAETYERNALTVLASGRRTAKALRHQGKLGLWQTFTGLPLTSTNGFGSAASTASNPDSYTKGSKASTWLGGSK